MMQKNGRHLLIVQGEFLLTCSKMLRVKICGQPTAIEVESFCFGRAKQSVEFLAISSGFSHISRTACNFLTKAPSNPKLRNGRAGGSAQQMAFPREGR